jgi:hypothetical protein
VKNLQTQQPQHTQFMKKTLFLAILGASAMSAEAITVTAGDLYAVDPTATSYGAVRFKDFTNTKDGGVGGNLYLQGGINANLGSGTGTDARARVQDSPKWTAGTSHGFTFEYRPVAESTDLILAQAANMTAPASRVIDDPALSVNFISFWIHNTPLNDVVTPDTIALKLTDLDGNTLTPSTLSVAAPGGDFNWYLTDPTLLANGFILTGFVNLTLGVDAGEGDKIDIKFGNAKVSTPDGGTTLVLLGGALTGLGALRRKFRK